MATCGIVNGTLRGAPAQTMSEAASANRAISSSVFWVGVRSFRVLLRASASAGAIQSCSTISVPSNSAICEAGVAAMKKRVS